MRRTAALLILAITLTACQSAPVQAVQSKWQQALHPCQSANLWDITWSPDSKKFAYSSNIFGNRDVYMVDVQARSITRLTNLASDESPWSWSPDGSRILLYNTPILRIMNADGSGFRNLDSPPNVDTLEWSPDGRQIAFVERYISMGLLDADGGTPIYFQLEAAPEPYIDWSPDGARLAFMQWNSGSDYSLMVVNADGTNPVEVISGESIGVPVWSPTSHSLAYVSGTVHKRLNVINADGTGLTDLSDRAEWPFVWLPDGSGLIALHLEAQSEISIVRVGLDGTTTTLAPLHYDYLSAFSPDGTKVAYISTEHGYPDLYVMNVDGTNQVQLTHNPGYQTCFDWPF